MLFACSPSGLFGRTHNAYSVQLNFADRPVAMPKTNSGGGFGFSRASSICYDDVAPVVCKTPRLTVHERIDGVEVLRLKTVPAGRMIYGIASTPTINSHGYSLLTKGCVVRLPTPLLSAHAKFGGPIGAVFHVEKSDSRLYVRARLFAGPAADYAWKLITSGETLSFSGAALPGSTTAEAEVDGVKFYSNWTLGEVSICRKGANPDCWAQIFNGEFATAASPGLGARGGASDSASATGRATSAVTWKSA